MHMARQAPSGATLDGKFYVCGGGNSHSRSERKQCEVYDPTETKWQPIAELKYDHYYGDAGDLPFSFSVFHDVSFMTCHV